MDREKRKIIETVCKKHGFEMLPSSIIYDERYNPPTLQINFLSHITLNIVTKALKL